MVGWVRDGETFPPASPDGPDGLREWRPWVVDESDGVRRMWDSGSDGTTSRILAAECSADGAWRRLGVAIDAAFAGDTDSYGVESPCVVTTPGGYLMVYGGSDGEISRLHMATSEDATRWDAQGTVMPRGLEDEAGATHPCLLITGEGWWLFFTGYARGAGERSAIMAAVSQTGASWDQVGTIMEPGPGEVAVSHPCVLEISRTMYAFYASDIGAPIRTALATSSDGLTWQRRGVVLEPEGQGPDGQGVHTPCVVRLHDGSMQMWYAGLHVGDEELGYRICSARFQGAWAH